MCAGQFIGNVPSKARVPVPRGTPHEGYAGVCASHVALGSWCHPPKHGALNRVVQRQTCDLVLADTLQAGLADADIYLSVYLKEFWVRFVSLNLFYLFCVCALFLFYFILKVNQYWPNSLNHLLSTENEVSVQVHKGPKGNSRVEVGTVPFPPGPSFFFFFP